MRTVAVSISALLCVHAGAASANECNLYEPHSGTPASLPLGCPVSVVIETNQAATFQPKVVTTRYDPHTGQGTQFDLTGAVTRDPDVQVPVHWFRYRGTCALQDDGFEPDTVANFEVALQGAQVGDVLVVAFDTRATTIVAAGPCPAFAAPELFCADGVTSCDDPASPPGPDQGGCNAGGPGGVGIVLALLAVLRCRAAIRR